MARSLSVNDQDKERFFEELLRTKQGRENLGRAILSKIKLDNLARKFLKIDKLQEGATAVYDCFSNYEKVMLNEDETLNFSQAQTRIVVPTFEVGLSLSLDKHYLHNGNIARTIQRNIEKINHDLNAFEERNFIEILKASIERNLIRKCVTNIFDIDYPTNYSIILNVYNAIWLEQKLGTNKIKNYFPIEIVSSEHCKKNEIFIIPNTEHLGIIPERVILSSYTYEDVGAGTTSWRFTEHIGMVINKPNLIVKFVEANQLNLSNHNKKFAFMSGGFDNVKRIRDEENRNVDLENKINNELIERLHE